MAQYTSTITLTFGDQAGKYIFIYCVLKNQLLNSIQSMLTNLILFYILCVTSRESCWNAENR